MNDAIQTDAVVSTPPAVRRKTPVLKGATVENRLTIKAAAADHAEFDAERSLGQMTDDEIRAVWAYLRTVPPREFGSR